MSHLLQLRQYTGRENEGRGLYFYRARYYSPLFARFVNENPLGFVGSGPNFYAYLADGRPDLMVAVIAGVGHFLLIFACLAGMLRMRPKAKQWGQFVAGGVLAVGYFAAIIIAAGPQYIGLLKRTFGL